MSLTFQQSVVQRTSNKWVSLTDNKGSVGLGTASTPRNLLPASGFTSSHLHATLSSCRSSSTLSTVTSYSSVFSCNLPVRQLRHTGKVSYHATLGSAATPGEVTPAGVLSSVHKGTPSSRWWKQQGKACPGQRAPLAGRTLHKKGHSSLWNFWKYSCKYHEKAQQNISHRTSPTRYYDWVRCRLCVIRSIELIVPALSCNTIYNKSLTLCSFTFPYSATLCATPFSCSGCSVFVFFVEVKATLCCCCCCCPEGAFGGLGGGTSLIFPLQSFSSSVRSESTNWKKANSVGSKPNWYTNWLDKCELNIARE